MSRFDRSLFEALAPKVGKIEIAEFTGSKKGDKVHIRFISPIKTEWKSDIIADGTDETKSFFVDKGVVLPFPLSSWEHHHVVEKIDENHSRIIDDMRYHANFWLLDVLLYPFVFLAFYPRKKIYKAYFNGK